MEILVLESAEGFERAVARAKEVLEAGGVSVLPTETVYGLCALPGRPEALERLHDLKNRPADMPVALLVSSAHEAARIGRIPPRAAPLLRKFWPGPLTIVVPRADGRGTVGLRVPASRFTQAVLERTGPVLATSANLHGNPPATTAKEALAAFADRVDLVVDGGPAPLGEASTVVGFAESGGFEVHREGILSARTVERALTTQILFVCTGNTCRSPMAEAILRSKLAERLGVRAGDLQARGYTVSSAGASAMPGEPASEHAVTTMRERGMDISGHVSRPLSWDLVEMADFIYALTDGHRLAILSYFPEAASRVDVLDDEGVMDPIGGDIATYRETADQIERGIVDRVLPAIMERDEPDESGTDTVHRQGMAPLTAKESANRKGGGSTA